MFVFSPLILYLSPSPSCLFPLLSLLLELPVLPGQLWPELPLWPLSSQRSSLSVRCCSSWYTEALPLLLCFGEEETKAGDGIRVSAEHCLSQASFLYDFF